MTISPGKIDPTTTQPESRGAGEGPLDDPDRNIKGLLSVIKARNDVAGSWEAELIKDANSAEKGETNGSRYPAEASVLGGVAIVLVVGFCIAFYVRAWSRHVDLIQRVLLMEQRLDLHEQQYNDGVSLRRQPEASERRTKERAPKLKWGRRVRPVTDVTGYPRLDGRVDQVPQPVLTMISPSSAQSFADEQK